MIYKHTNTISHEEKKESENVAKKDAQLREVVKGWGKNSDIISNVKCIHLEYKSEIEVC